MQDLGKQVTDGENVPEAWQVTAPPPEYPVRQVTVTD
jgi:hypothetical protein